MLKIHKINAPLDLIYYTLGNHTHVIRWSIKIGKINTSSNSTIHMSLHDPLEKEKDDTTSLTIKIFKI